jgi:hypothetical protein
MFRPSMVLNQRQVSLVVSDRESYLGSLGCTVCLWVIVYVDGLFQRSFTVDILFTVFVFMSFGGVLVFYSPVYF